MKTLKYFLVNTQSKTMKLFKQTTRLLAAAALVAVPLATFAADQKKEEPALMQPVKSVLDHYLTIQTEQLTDSSLGAK